MKNKNDRTIMIKQLGMIPNTASTRQARDHNLDDSQFSKPKKDKFNGVVRYNTKMKR
jgi:hypothetical protein